MSEINLPTLAPLLSEGAELVKSLPQIHNDEDLGKAELFFTFIKRRIKEIEADLAKDLEPKIELLHKMHKDGVALRKSVLDPWEKAKRTLQSTISAYLENKRREADKKMLEKQTASSLLDELDGNPAPTGDIQDLLGEALDSAPVSSLSKRTYWKYRVVDAEKIPRAYLMPNHTMLQDIATSRKSEAVGTVPGVEFYSEEKVI